MRFLRSRSQGEKPAFLKFRSSRWFILFVVGFAIFTDIFLYGVIVPVLPFALHSRVGIEPSSVQHWVSIMLAVYAVGLLVTSPIWGYTADHLSSRGKPFLAGLVALVLATVLLMLGWSIPVIVAGRLLQGMSAALVWTVGLAIVSDTVGTEHVGEAMGWVTLGVSVGVFFGPLLGGIVFARAGYYAVFGMALAVVFFDIILRLLMIEAKVAAKYEVSAAADAASSEEPKSAPAPEAEAAPAAAATEEQGAPPQEPARRKRKLPSLLILLKTPRLIVALYGCLVQAALLSSFDSVLPLYVNRIFGWDSLGAGLIFIPLLIPSIFEPLIGKLSDMYGARVMAVPGFILTLPFYVLLRFVSYDSIGQKVLLCALLFLVGITISLVLPPLTAEITRIVIDMEAEDPDVFGGKSAFAQAFALLNVAFAAGTAIGPLWGGFVTQSAGWGTMCWTLGLWSVTTAVPIYIWTSPPPKRKPESSEQETMDVSREA